ncbi:ABC transporter permease subunit [Dermabacteraceae bacterium TAE3-ERU27]|nr:ABC transporter permease subunit [Dermabacteraceae bacterium TAE3-ERU27]
MNWLINNLPLVQERLLAHLALTLPPILLSLLLAIPIGLLAQRVRPLRGALLSGFALLYAIPSLPLFIVLPILIGTSLRSELNVIVALTLYGLALLVRPVADGLDGVPADVTAAATAVGMHPVGRFFTVDLPLAGPVILAGLRVVAVSTTSLVTVGAVLGIPSLGILFTDGLQRGIGAEIMTGIVATVALALLLDRLLVLLGKIVLPWTRHTAKGAAK